jgi:peptidyl-prolyl cis-trans isomerase C
MLKISRLAALLIAGAIISAPVFAAEKGKAFATVNGQAIPQSVYDAFVAEQKAQGTPDPPELKNAVKEELIRREILAQEATSRARWNSPSKLY